jgi:hypothetical protein
MLNHFSLSYNAQSLQCSVISHATVLSHSSCSSAQSFSHCYIAQPFLLSYNAQPFLVLQCSAILVNSVISYATMLNHFPPSYSAHPFSSCYSAQPFSIELQCLAIFHCCGAQPFCKMSERRHGHAGREVARGSIVNAWDRASRAEYGSIT